MIHHRGIPTGRYLPSFDLDSALVQYVPFKHTMPLTLYGLIYVDHDANPSQVSRSAFPFWYFMGLIESKIRIHGSIGAARHTSFMRTGFYWSRSGRTLHPHAARHRIAFHRFTSDYVHGLTHTAGQLSGNAYIQGWQARHGLSIQ